MCVVDGQQGKSSLSLSHLLFFSSICRRSLHSGFWFLFLGAERFISRSKRNLPKAEDVGAFGRLPLVPPSLASCPIVHLPLCAGWIRSEFSHDALGETWVGGHSSGRWRHPDTLEVVGLNPDIMTNKQSNFICSLFWYNIHLYQNSGFIMWNKRASRGV